MWGNGLSLLSIFPPIVISYRIIAKHADTYNLPLYVLLEVWEIIQRGRNRVVALLSQIERLIIGNLASSVNDFVNVLVSFVPFLVSTLNSFLLRIACRPSKQLQKQEGVGR